MTREANPAWMATAACLNLTDLMFVETGGRGNKDAAAAKALCRSCPHIEACREWAIERGEQFGIWGGLTPRERRQERARRSRMRAA